MINEQTFEFTWQRLKPRPAAVEEICKVIFLKIPSVFLNVRRFHLCRFVRGVCCPCMATVTSLLSYFLFNLLCRLFLSLPLLHRPSLGLRFSLCLSSPSWLMPLVTSLRLGWGTSTGSVCVCVSTCCRAAAEENLLHSGHSCISSLTHTFMVLFFFSCVEKAPKNLAILCFFC